MALSRFPSARTRGMGIVRRQNLKINRVAPNYFVRVFPTAANCHVTNCGTSQAKNSRHDAGRSIAMRYPIAGPRDHTPVAAARQYPIVTHRYIVSVAFSQLRAYIVDTVSVPIDSLTHPKGSTMHHVHHLLPLLVIGFFCVAVLARR